MLGANSAIGDLDEFTEHRVPGSEQEHIYNNRAIYKMVDEAMKGCAVREGRMR